MAVQYALIADNGEVQHVVSSGADSDYVTGQVYHGLLAVQVSSDTDAHHLINTTYYVDGTWHSREPRSSPWQDWVGNAWAFNASAFWVHVRRERDIKLGVSDWTQMPDVHLNLGAEADWATYRQALRNVPADNADVTSLTEVSWPTVPGS